MELYSETSNLLDPVGCWNSAVYQSSPIWKKGNTLMHWSSNCTSLMKTKLPLLSLAIKELPIAKQLPNIDKSVGKWLFMYTTGKRRNLCSHLTTCIKNSILFLGEWSPNISYLINYIMHIYYTDELVGIFEYLKFGCIFHSMKYDIVSQSQGKIL